MSSFRVADRYSVDREIGRGGSSSVWMAWDEVLGRPVALKKIGLLPGASAADVARAEREARLAARVIHPNVVSVFDFVEDGDSYWLVTEYVDGATLARTVNERGALSPDEAGPLLLQIAEALAAAHGLGIVHRDVKPSNILVGADGHVKLADFGIARRVADATLTQTGIVTGSPAYLAPEVATGSAATPASDVWSFGTTVFHTLAGRPPYEAPDGELLAVLYQIAHEPPPRLEEAGWLAPLLAATMEKDPERRPPMDEVVRFLRSSPQHPAPAETQVLPTPVPQVEPEPSPSPAVMTRPVRLTAPVPAASSVAPPKRRASTGNRALRAALAGAAVVAVLAVIGVLLIASGGDDDPGPQATKRSGGGPASTPATDDTTAAASPTEAELEDFAASYVSTAADDPDAGFALLTRDYQSRSPDYADFWGSVDDPEIIDVSADPADMTVTYTYRYDLQGEGTRTETVTLHLVESGDQLLIDDAVSSG